MISAIVNRKLSHLRRSRFALRCGIKRSLEMTRYHHTHTHIHTHDLQKGFLKHSPKNSGVMSESMGWYHMCVDCDSAML